MKNKIAIAVLVLFACVAAFYTNVSSRSEDEAVAKSTNTSSMIQGSVIQRLDIVSNEVDLTTNKNRITVEEIVLATESIPESEESAEEESEFVEVNSEVQEEMVEEQEESVEAVDVSPPADDYIMIIASVVEAETKGQDMDAKIHIVHVIRNRVNSASFPNDYYSVCTASNQFASRWDIEQSTIDAVNQGLAMEDTTNGALFFCLCKEGCWLNGTSYQYLFTDSAGHHFWG